MMMRLMLATTAGLIWGGAAFAQSGCGGPVTFAQGQNSALVGGRIVGASACDFQLSGQAGQRLSASINSQGRVAARVIAPVQHDLAGQPWELPQSGEYTVRLSQNPDNASMGQAPQFTVEFRITGAATPATATTRPQARPAGRTVTPPITPAEPAPATRPAAPDSAAATAPATRPAPTAVAGTRPQPRPASAPAPATPPASTPAPPAPAATAQTAPASGTTTCTPAEPLDRDAIAISGRIASGGHCDYTITSSPGQTLTLVMPRADGFRVQLTAPTQATLTSDQPLPLPQDGAQTVRITRTGSGAGDFVARLRLDRN
ncbi:MAG: hypothetical protein Q4G14_13120 [Paracoccus sp. (in: a-proteobacteria)]|uniref:hypothetical protein n=1 Tax=Paracoccus sp. TaxID=267 RepID=UPI0026DF0AD8|nr:hypothetical protein [Paracoccus sp. (in: a-proteobacteria)]MDO5614164.1 hypothetical protein [Paracoccus sp. (in: a-proteobacteria)]